MCDARFLLGYATGHLAPSPELEGWWDGYNDVAMAFAADETVCMHSITEMRRSLEYIVGDDRGELLIAASKMVLSAMILLVGNPTGGLVFQGSIIHDDMEPLLRKAVHLLQDAGDLGDERLVVEFDSERPAQIAERNDKNKMRFLIENAVRPENN